MMRYLLILLAGVLLSMPSPAQEQSGAAESPAAEGDSEEQAEAADDAGSAEADAAGDDEVDDSDLDEQVYEQDEDDFIPSEEIPADEAIPFPTNI